MLIGGITPLKFNTLSSSWKFLRIFFIDNFKFKFKDFIKARSNARLGTSPMLRHLQLWRLHCCFLIFKLKGFMDASSYSSWRLHKCFLIFKLKGFIDASSYSNSKPLTTLPHIQIQNSFFLQAKKRKKNLHHCLFKQVWRL